MIMLAFVQTNYSKKLSEKSFKKIYDNPFVSYFLYFCQNYWNFNKLGSESFIDKIVNRYRAQKLIEDYGSKKNCENGDLDKNELQQEKENKKVI